MKTEADGYELWCVVDGDHRETILSYDPEDANIDQPHRIFEVYPMLTVENILPLISEVTENAVNYTNNTIREEVKNSIENLEAAIQQIQDGETDEAVETIMDEVMYLSEREDLWRIHIEDVGDEAAQTLKALREGETE